MLESYQSWLAFRRLFDTCESRPLLERTGVRFAVDINYGTDMGEVIDHYSQLCLGYLKKAFNNHGFPVKQVYSVKPYRLIISTRQWQDREWVGIVNFDEPTSSFVWHEGLYDKGRKTAGIPDGASKKLSGKSAAALFDEIMPLLRALKDKPLRYGENLKPALRKRGPKR